MKKSLLIGALITGLPLVSIAEPVPAPELERDFEGLNVQADIIGSATDDGIESAATPGIQLLEVTNLEAVEITCQMEPGPTEGPMFDTASAIVAPGETVQLEMGSDYSVVTSQARLSCRTAE